MYLNSENEVGKGNSSVSTEAKDDLESQLAKNFYLESEVRRFSQSLTQFDKSRIGRIADAFERLCRRQGFLRDARRIAFLPIDERDAFSKVLCDGNNQEVRERTDYLSAEYAHLVDELQPLQDSGSINEEAIQALENNNAELFQSLVKSQASVGKWLGGLSGFLLRVIEVFWVVVQAGGGNKRYLWALWADYLSFSRDHSSELKAFNGSGFNRVGYFLQVLRFALANPYACLRTFSWARLWRLVRVLCGLEQLNGAAWIEQRFPLDSSIAEKPIIFSVDQEGANSLELAFPEYDEPLVSIIIPVYNQYATTLSCLQSVLAHTHGVTYEVVIADDRSSDVTESIDNRIKNIRVVRNEINLGFLKNCNNAVGFAKGKYIVLLNNDTNPQPGWLQSLLDVFTSQDRVGLVGPKLLFEDGVLQEAGGIIWRDGSGWNFGRGQNPDGPEFNYLKDVDYISGACVMLEKSLWNELGGFDECFCPAYYEDTDLAFQIRAAGLRTIYQPAASVVHFEGVSHGSDINSGIKKQQRINQVVFQKKWAAVLGAENHTAGNNVFDARERAGDRRTVLYIDHYVPFYDKDAGSRSTFLYVKTMVEMGYRVKFLGANFFPHQPYTSTLQAMGVEVLYGERYAKNWKEWLKENACNIDVIYLHRPHITEDFIGDITALKNPPKLVYFGHDLHYLRTEREGAIKEDETLLKESISWKERERRIFKQVDTVLYPSDVEVQAVQELEPDINVEQIPLYLLDSPERIEFVHASRKDLLFVGGFTHAPNVDAVIWFVSKVLPIVLASEPDIRFHVVGSNVPEIITRLASKNVLIHGFVEDSVLQRLYESVRLCVVPLRYGAGVKGKVLEALQANVPLLTTPIGAEGIPEADSVMAIAETESSFADQVLDLYENREPCMNQLDNRANHIERYFSLDVVKSTIERHFGKAVRNEHDS